MTVKHYKINPFSTLSHHEGVKLNKFLLTIFFFSTWAPPRLLLQHLL